MRSHLKTHAKNQVFGLGSDQLVTTVNGQRQVIAKRNLKVVVDETYRPHYATLQQFITKITAKKCSSNTVNSSDICNPLFARPRKISR